MTASDDNTARLWDAPSSKSIQHDDIVESAAFSPDGKWVVPVG